MAGFNGLGMSMGTLSRLSDAESRSICAENFTGEKGKGGMATDGTGATCAADLGQGWKVSPSVVIAPGQTFTMADIEGPGAIQHIWMTVAGIYRFSILRIHWERFRDPFRRGPGRRFLRLRLAKIRPDFLACGLRQPG